VAKGGRDVFIHCGSRSVSWGELVAATNCVIENTHRFLFTNTSAMARIGALQAACEDRDSKTSRTLLSQLIRHRSFGSTEPQDKVYALCGLASDLGPEKLNIKPDYTLKVDEVYKRVAQSILSYSCSLDLLSVSRISEHSTVSNLPTWVPDWSDQGDTSLMLTRYSWTGDCSYRFHAARGSKAEPRFTDNGMCLQLSGFVHDVIEEVGYLCERRDQEYSSIITGLFTKILTGPLVPYAIINWFQVARVWSDKKYIGGGNIMDALWRTLVIDQYGDVDARADFLEWVRFITWYMPLHVLCIDRVWPLYCIIGVIIVYIQDLTIARHNPSEGEKRFRARLGSVQSRRMIRTQMGYIGLAPRRTQVGDSIALFEGGRVPLVIRPYGTSWQLIGESYVHGIMQGEIFNEAKCKTMRLV
jgi:hypothetical protein